MLSSIKGLGVKEIVVIDSIGSTNVEESYSDYRPILTSSIMSLSEVSRHKKTVFFIADTEEMVFASMDAIEKALGTNMKKPDTGIIFSVPALKFWSNYTQTNSEKKTKT